MDKLNKNDIGIIESRITEFLEKKFSFRDYFNSVDLTGYYEVNGEITRYGNPVNVQVTIKKDDFTPTYWMITDEAITLCSRFLGEITLGKDVCVSDPCYDRDVWCMTVLHNVKPGKWDARVSIDTISSFGERCYVLELFHRTVREVEDFDWREIFELGVDSGTMSVIDDAYYQQKKPSNSKAEEAAAERFLENCYKAADKKAGIYRYGDKKVGVVCSSGTGDGSYPLYTAEKDGEVVAIKISFM